MFSLDERISLQNTATTIRQEAVLRNRETMTISKCNGHPGTKEYYVSFYKYAGDKIGGRSYGISADDFDNLHKQGVHDATNYRTLTH